MRSTPLLLIILLSSCYTENKARKGTIKAYTHFPNTVAELAGKWFPPKVLDSSTTTTIKPGITTQLPPDTILIDCDSVITAGKADKTVNTKAVKGVCPPCKERVDTMVIRTNKTVENTATIDGLNGKLKKAETTLIKRTQARTIWMWIAIAGWGLIILWIVFKVLKAKSKIVGV